MVDDDEAPLIYGVEFQVEKKKVKYSLDMIRSIIGAGIMCGEWCTG
jgi:hypothetical protein